MCFSQAIRREIKVRSCHGKRIACCLTLSTQLWSSLLHPHILRKLSELSRRLAMLTVNAQEFLGANILDDKPFILMPFMRNGNVRDYIECNPDCDRQKIVSELALFWIGCFDGFHSALPCLIGASVSPRSEYRTRRS